MALSGNVDQVQPIVAEINYPLNGHSIGSGIEVSGASVGQTVKIAEVDDNGVPTAWEPADLPAAVTINGQAADENGNFNINTVTDDEIAQLNTALI